MKVHEHPCRLQLSGASGPRMDLRRAYACVASLIGYYVKAAKQHLRSLKAERV